MTHKLEKQIRHARPKLRAVSPLPYWIILVMGFFNIALGLTFLFGLDVSRLTASLLIVNEMLTFQFWGVVFILLGLIKIYALAFNRWTLARNSLFIGVSIKAAWMVALTLRTIISPGTFLLNLLWITIALIQMGAYIWFMPPEIGTKKVKEDKV